MKVLLDECVPERLHDGIAVIVLRAKNVTLPGIRSVYSGVPLSIELSKLRGPLP